MFFCAGERTIEVCGCRTTYVTFGIGKKPLVIIPGLSLRSIHGAALPLAWMYRMFAREYRVYVIDRKEDIREGCTVSDLADDLAGAMCQLGIESADIIGISQGGMIAQCVALNYPHLVHKLVLGVTLSRTNGTVQAVVSDWIRAAEHGDYPAIVRDVMERMYSESYIRKYRWLFPILLKTVRLNDPERFIRLAKACLTCDTYGFLDQIRCPVLVLGGKEDRIVTGEASEEMAARIGCPIHMYAHLGHSAYEEAPDFNRRIFDFLQQRHQ